MKKFNEDLYEIRMKNGEEVEKFRNSDIERERESLRKAEEEYMKRFNR